MPAKVKKLKRSPPYYKWLGLGLGIMEISERVNYGATYSANYVFGVIGAQAEMLQYRQTP